MATSNIQHTAARVNSGKKFASSETRGDPAMHVIQQQLAWLGDGLTLDEISTGRMLVRDRAGRTLCEVRERVEEYNDGGRMVKRSRVAMLREVCAFADAYMVCDLAKLGNAHVALTELQEDGPLWDRVQRARRQGAGSSSTH